MTTLTICQIRHCFAGQWTRGNSHSSEVCGRFHWRGGIKWVEVVVDGTLGPGGEGPTVRGHYSSVVQVLADTLRPLLSVSLCLSALFPCSGWSPETGLGLIYSPSLPSYAWLPLQWRNFLSPLSLLQQQRWGEGRQSSEMRVGWLTLEWLLHHDTILHPRSHPEPCLSRSRSSWKATLITPQQIHLLKPTH